METYIPVEKNALIRLVAIARAHGESYPNIFSPIYTATIKGQPTTKKNSSRIVKINGHYSIIPSKQYKRFEADAIKQLTTPSEPISKQVTVKCTFYRETKRRVDLTNLLEAIDDILVTAGVLEDDCCTILVSHDGSRVILGSDEPRTEIEIFEEVKKNET